MFLASVEDAGLGLGLGSFSGPGSYLKVLEEELKDLKDRNGRLIRCDVLAPAGFARSN